MSMYKMFNLPFFERVTQAKVRLFITKLLPRSCYLEDIYIIQKNYSHFYWPVIVSAPVSVPSWSVDVRLSLLCRSFSMGIETGRCWSVFLLSVLLSTSVGWESPVLSFLSCRASATGILVFLRPLAGALAVLRRRWSVMERLRGGTPMFVSTEDFELLLNKPLKPRSWRPWGEKKEQKEILKDIICISILYTWDPAPKGFILLLM